MATINARTITRKPTETPNIVGIEIPASGNVEPSEVGDGEIAAMFPLVVGVGVLVLAILTLVGVGAVVTVEVGP